MTNFLSSALGEPHDYRFWISDSWHIVALGRSQGDDGNIMCRAAGSTDPYSDIYHNHAQCRQVMLDMDAAYSASY